MASPGSPAAQLNPGAGAAESLSRKSATWLLNIVAIGYAATAVAVKAMEDSASVSSASLEAAVSSPACAASVQFALRFCLAAALFAPSALFLQRGQRDAASLESTLGSATAPSSDGGEPGAARWHGVELGVWMFVTYAGQAVGLQTSSAHHAATLLSLSIVLVPLLEAAVGRAAAGPRSPSVWIATLLATAGMVLLEGGAGADAEALVSSSSCVWGWGAMAMPVGHVWCIVGAAASAIHVVRSEMLCGASRPLALISSQLATAAALSCGWVAWDVVAGGVDAASLWATAAAAAPFSSSAAASSSWLLLFLIGPVGTVGAAASAIHVVRSEMLCGASRPLALISSQLATAAALSCGWVAWDVVAGGVDAASLWATAAAAAPFSSSAAASSSWLLLFLIGPVGTGLCEWLELEALRSVKASTATLILTAAPLWATLLAYLFLGESVDSSFAAGAVLILFACLEAQLLHGHGEEGEESPHATRDEAQGDSGLQLSSCQVAVEHRPRVAALLHAGSRMLQRSKGFGREAARGWSEDARAITALIRTSWSARHVARGLQPLAEENKLAESQHRAGGGLGSGREDGRFGGRLRKVPSALTQAFREVRNKGSDLQR
eukprot:jgi/Mesen1/9970/ME000072S09377